MDNNQYKMQYTTDSDKQLKLTVILACFGEIPLIEKRLEETINNLYHIKDHIMLIAVTDGIKLSELPTILNIKHRFPYVKIIHLNQETHQPAKIMNAALEHINTPYVSFAWAGSRLNWTIQEFAQNSIMDFPVYTINNLSVNKIYFDPPTPLIYGWSQCTRLYELNNLIISNNAIKLIGEFDQSPILQKDFDWEWMLRLSKHFIFNSLGSTSGNNALTFNNYPFRKLFKYDNDIIHRYLLRNRPLPYNNVPGISKTEISFLKDLPSEDVQKINRKFVENGFETCFKMPLLLFGHFKKRYKITLIGGYWEYHHIQLCFLNYLDKLYGKGFATYKLLLDVIADPQDVIGSDLVIITRSRNPNILNIINKCREDQILTLYMIDDNWFSVAEDFPEVYGHLFISGNPEFETFLEAIKECNAVITYNKNLYLDICKYNENTILFPFNINLNFYSKYKKTNEQNKIIVGYAGSLRLDDTAFKALSKAARKNNHIRVLLFGSFSQSQLSLFKDLDIINQDYLPYPIYCNMIQQISPDILLAPLINNKTSISKCPNKYLEIGAIKAAGIYSNVYPYNSIIKDKVNGLLVSDNTIEAWEEKILLLVNNSVLRSSIAQYCYNDVKKHYSTNKFIGKFCKMIEKLMQNGGSKND